MQPMNYIEWEDDYGKPHIYFTDITEDDAAYGPLLVSLGLAVLVEE